MFRYALTSLRANLTRLVSTVLAVVIGITFLASGLMLTDAMRDGLTGDVERQYGGVDLAVALEDRSEEFGVAATLPEGTLDAVRDTDGVAAAEGELRVSATVEGSDGVTANLRSQGRVWIDDDELRPVELTDGAAPTGTDEVVLDEKLLDDADVEVGDRVRLETPSGPTEATVTGSTRFGGRDSLDDGGTIWFPTDAATELLASGDEPWSRILVRTGGEADTAGIASVLADELGPTVDVVDRAGLIEQETEVLSAVIDVLRPILQGFAYLSMFVAAFVIFNTFSVVVTQRFRELALIRAVGGTPAQVRRSLLVEGLGIGLGASAVGIVAGALLTLGVQWGLDRFDLGFPTGSPSITGGTVLLCMVIGTVVTVLSVLIPAWRAGRTRPVEAMRDSAVDTSGTSTVRAVIGGGLLVAAIVLLLVNRFVGAQWYYLAPGGLFLFVGLVVGGPLLARLFSMLAAPLLARVGLTGRLAADNSVRNPRRTATTANALVIGLFLVTLVTVSGEAVKSYVVGQVNELSSSDFFVGAERDLSEDLVAEIRGIDDVSGVAALRAAVAVVDDDPAFFTTTDLSELGDVAGMTVQDGSLEAVVDGTGIAVPDLGQFGGGGQAPLRLGDTVDLVGTDGETRTLTVEAILDDAGVDSFFVGYLVGAETFETLFGDQPVNFAFVRVEPGTADAVGGELERVIDGYTGVEVQPGNFLGQIIGDLFDFLIGAVNALLGMSVIVALVGIVNTMTLAIFERRRELGMVRALGMTRQQVGRMIRVEAVLIGLLGTLVGMAAGIFASWVVVSGIDDGAIGLSFNWARVGVIFGVGVLVGVLAAAIPARRATRLDMLEAMHTT